MKILHLSKMDYGGGAADGFVRIHQALLSQGHDSVAYVIKHRRTDVAHLIDARHLLGFWQKMKWGLGRIFAKSKRWRMKPVGVYDFDTEANFPAQPLIEDAKKRHNHWDLILIHWAGGFVRPETIQEIAQALGARVALWQIDMAHVTGGCHYNYYDCMKYVTGCGACPLIGSKDPHDVSFQQAQVRRKVWSDLAVKVFAPTPWSAGQAKESWILKDRPLEIFPIPLNLEILRPASNRESARKLFDIPQGVRVMLVRGINPALSPHKGFGLLLEALRLVDAEGIPLYVLVVGEKGLLGEQWKHVTFKEVGMKRGDSEISTVYQAADYFVNPSINDNGPMMVGEALVSGVPVIAFPVGLPAVPWNEGRVGMVVKPIGDVVALAHAIKTFAEMSEEDLSAMKLAAAEAARNLYSAKHYSDALEQALRS